MELYYLLVQRSLWTVHLLIVFILSSEGRHSHRKHKDWKIHVPAPPEILTEAHNVTVHSNERIVLRCTVRNRRTKDVQWRLIHTKYPLTIGTETWTSDKDISVFYTKYNDTDEGWDLVIKEAKPRHTNTYECQISTMKSNRRYVHLTVLDKPVEKIPAVELTGTAYLDINQKVNLTCNATGVIRAPEDVDWFHNGNIIDHHNNMWGQRLTISKQIPQIPGRWLISELIIEKSTLKDQGMYICRSSDNEAASFYVTILDNGVLQKQKRNGLDNVNPDQSAKDTKPNSSALNKVNIVVMSILIIISKS